MGEVDAMTDDRTLTTRAVADRLGISECRVLRVAQIRGVGQRYGRSWLFNEADVRALAVKGKPGRPRKGDQCEPWP